MFRERRFILLSALVVVLAALAGFIHYRVKPDATPSIGLTGAPAGSSDVLPPDIQAACSACHLAPPPDVLPRDQWAERIDVMYKLAAEQNMTIPADMARVLGHYQQHAPERLAEVSDRTDAGPGRNHWWRLEWRPAGAGSAHKINPAVAYLAFLDLIDGPELELVGADMHHGVVFALRPYRADPGFEFLAAAGHPSHVELGDLDRDGRKDLLVADLGVEQPSDEKRGRVLWVRGLPGGRFQTIELATGLGRVADVRAADLDGDGDTDIAVAVFGWHHSGSVSWFENTSPPGSAELSFVQHDLDPRSGAIHVPIVDIDNDGDLDIVAVISQEHEQVMAYLREGDTFVAREIYRAPHPSWGSSGIEPVDIDADGDLDILMTHGDSLDDFLLKPYHGIDLLVNTDPSSLRFERQPLTSMYGVHRALPVDLDGDGDLDIIASAFLPHLTEQRHAGRASMEGVLWLERTPAGWVRRVLQQDRAQHAALAVGDFNLDGTTDFATGNFRFERGDWTPLDHWITVWRNARWTPPDTEIRTEDPIGEATDR